MMFEDFQSEDRYIEPTLEELRAQVAELLPWARLGAHTAADDHEDIARFVVLGSRRIPLRAAKAQNLLIRIDSGEFGGVS